MDGVIVSTDRLHYVSWAEICKEWDIPFSEEDNDLLRGVSRMDSVEIILKNSGRLLTQEDKTLFADAKNERYVKLLTKLTKNDLLPGVSNVIKELAKRGIKKAIGSSSKNAATIMKMVGISDWFNAVVDGNMIHNSKPNPEVFVLAAAALGLPAEVCIVVEDAESGISAAKRAGCLAAAVGAARRSDEADFVLERIEDLLKYI